MYSVRCKIVPGKRYYGTIYVLYCTVQLYYLYTVLYLYSCTEIINPPGNTTPSGNDTPDFTRNVI